MVKKTKYNKLVRKVDNINITGTSNLVKKTDYNTKTNEIQNRNADHDHAKYITTHLFKTYFDEKLKNLNKKVTSKETRHIEFNTKLDNLEKK